MITGMGQLVVKIKVERILLFFLVFKLDVIHSIVTSKILCNLEASPYLKYHPYHVHYFEYDEIPCVTVLFVLNIFTRYDYFRCYVTVFVRRSAIPKIRFHWSQKCVFQGEN